MNVERSTFAGLSIICFEASEKGSTYMDVRIRIFIASNVCVHACVFENSKSKKSVLSGGLLNLTGRVGFALHVGGRYDGTNSLCGRLKEHLAPIMLVWVHSAHTHAHIYKLYIYIWMHIVKASKPELTTYGAAETHHSPTNVCFCVQFERCICCCIWRFKKLGASCFVRVCMCEGLKGDPPRSVCVLPQTVRIQIKHIFETQTIMWRVLSFICVASHECETFFKNVGRQRWKLLVWLLLLLLSSGFDVIGRAQQAIRISMHAITHTQLYSHVLYRRTWTMIGTDVGCGWAPADGSLLTSPTCIVERHSSEVCLCLGAFKRVRVFVVNKYFFKTYNIYFGYSCVIVMLIVVLCVCELEGVVYVCGENNLCGVFIG